MTIMHAARLSAFRAELARRRLDGFVVPLTDAHLGEYVPDEARRLHWLTGFGGSAGTAVVLADTAAIFVDGRYTLQVTQEVDAAHWRHLAVPATSPAAWLGEQAHEGMRIGYDPWLHTRAWAAAAERALATRGAMLVAVDDNPVDTVWSDQPSAPASAVEPYPDALAGRSSADKRREIADTLDRAGADVAILTALDSIAWAFNIRGADVDHTPVAQAFALVHADATADLFVAPDKLGDEARRHLGNAVRLHDYAAFPAALHALGGRRVLVDPERAVAAIFGRLEDAGAGIVEGRDPALLPKATKNAVELAGHRAAQARDGAALAGFLHWLSVEAPRGGLDELTAAAKLRAFREASGQLRDLSFDTISGAGPNGAIVHYRASAASNRRLEPGSLYLVDSGGQYADGTTDVTRTVAIGTPDAEMRDRFTRVLKGHIALARAVFPEGTRGGQLDPLARRYLWAAGLDYAHGTGHGVGAYLAVHEGPQRIASAAGGQPGIDEPLLPGMILSNEPGYYKPGAWGIRIENLVVVERREVAGAEKPCLGFETLTHAPIDRTLIEAAMLDADERAWIDAYHAEVLARIGPQVEHEVREWLAEVCAPLVQAPPLQGRGVHPVSAGSAASP